jgi:hypothetical protein
LERGEQTEVEINLENQDNEPKNFQLYPMDFSVNKDNQFIFSPPGEPSYSPSKWLSLSQEEILLPPGQRATIGVTIQVPLQVEPGGHYAALFVESAASSASSEGASVSIGIYLVSLFYLTIAGLTDAEIITNLEITSLILPGWVEGGSVDLGVEVHNSGNVHADFATKVWLSDFRGREIGELDLGQQVILPNGERVIQGEWNKLPLFGRVKVKATIGYFNQQGELVNKSQESYFWVIPWKLLVGIVLGIGLLYWLYRFLSRRYRLRVERK